MNDTMAFLVTITDLGPHKQVIVQGYAEARRITHAWCMLRYRQGKSPGSICMERTMTELEARDRAAKIWGTQVKQVTRSYIPERTFDDAIRRPEWNVLLHNGSYHSFDRNGHPDCHQECDDAAVMVCT